MSNLKSLSSSQDHPTHGHTVTPEESGTRLDKLMADFPNMVSREMARRLILQGEVRLNDRIGEPAQKVRPGDEIAYRIPPPEEALVPAQKTDLDVLHEDQWLIVINKPAGMTMHPGPGHANNTLVNYLLGHCTDLSGIGGRLRPGVVHRLDKDTSGIVVCAKCDEAHQGLSEQFKARTVLRTYYALTVGSPAQDKGTINQPLDRQKDHWLKRAVSPEGKEAVTRWRVLERIGPFTLMEMKLKTGRTHQIRVHMSHQDWPLLGDPLYGRGRHRGLDLPPGLMETLEKFKRQALHAAELGFIHPMTGEFLKFTRDFPPDMTHILQTVRAVFGQSPGNSVNSPTNAGESAKSASPPPFHGVD